MATPTRRWVALAVGLLALAVAADLFRPEPDSSPPTSALPAAHDG